MYKLLTKHGQLFAFGIGLLIIIIFFITVMGGLDGFNALTKEDQGTTTIFDTGLYLTIVLLVLCAIAAVLFGIWQMITNPKSAIKGIIGLVALIVVFGALYSMSEAETTGAVGSAVEKFNVSDSQSKIISAGIKSTLLLGGLAALAFVVSEIRNFFK